MSNGGSGRFAPTKPLPDLGRKFDLITAFSIDFNRESKRDWWWGPPEWAFFLDDLKRHLNPGGRIFLGLNPKRDGEYYTPELREFFLSRGASVERENVAFSAKLTAAFGGNRRHEMKNHPRHGWMTDVVRTTL